MNSYKKYRPLSSYERVILDRLLESDFPGRSQIAEQLGKCLVRTIDEEGSLELHVQTDLKAEVKRRIPIEGEVEDADGILIHVLLHVVNGVVTELEIYKDNSSPIIIRPDASKLRLIKLEEG